MKLLSVEWSFGRQSNLLPSLLILLALLTPTLTQRQQQQHHHHHQVHQQTEVESDASNPDRFEGSSQSKHEPKVEQQSSSSYDRNDPFAVTFEDYFREASANGGESGESGGESQAISSDRNDLIIDNDDFLPSNAQESQVIDYVFPPAKQQHQQQLSVDSDNGRIKLHFAWKYLASSRCSKSCGKGYRINHPSCVDLKYDVRVADELCLSKLGKPSEESDQPCNEIDCPARWETVEYQECDLNAPNSAEVCRPKLYKRTRCSRTTRTGALLVLEDSNCANASNSKPVEVELDERESSLDFDEEQKNDILSNLELSFSQDPFAELTNGKSNSKNHPMNEPFYEASGWSQCSGNSCGQLGKRHRKLTCRLFMSRSGKFSDLPESSCQHLSRPDIDEPCYIDCIPEAVELATRNSSEENSEEVVYDMEMARFVWRRDLWSKCTAECLGGLHESIVECWDKVAEVAVEQSLCDPLSKPSSLSRTCNDIPCAPQWKAEPFSACSKSCGSSGIRTRQVVCTQQVSSSNGGVKEMLVSNDLCIQTSNASMPAKLEPCNRVDCRPEWSVSGWSECSAQCGEGTRNRTVVCLQEFANVDGPDSASSHRFPFRSPSSNLTEAVKLAAQGWHPGKLAQIPFEECYEETKTVPHVEEKCFKFCRSQPSIDSNPNQDYKHNLRDRLKEKRKFVTLKIGGKAELPEGKNVKIRCKVQNVLREKLVRSDARQLVWRFDGFEIFPNGSKRSDKQFSTTDDNNILANSLQLMSADEPVAKRSERFSAKSRSLQVRSWNHHQTDFSFVAKDNGRFSLIKENTLRIKNLERSDSGIYTCTFGALKESIELKVSGRLDSLDDNQGI